MTGKILKLNEGALLAANLPRDFIEVMRHLVRQAGPIAFDTTLPEVASQTDGLTPIVNGLTITITATNQTVSALEADASEHSFIDTSIARRLDDADAAQLDQLSRTALIRMIEELQADRASLDFNLANIIRRIQQLEDA